MAFGFESPARVRDTRADSWGEFEKSGHSFRREIIGQAAVIGYVPIRRFPMSGNATNQDLAARTSSANSRLGFISGSEGRGPGDRRDAHRRWWKGLWKSRMRYRD